MTGPGLVAVAIAEIDRRNADDPVTVMIEGVARPKEIVHAERMTHWLAVIDPGAGPAQQLAARAHHLRRWVTPRTDYPEGRAGYLRWRADHKRRQADEVGTLLAEVGIEPEIVAHVQRIVAKVGLATDPAVQAHEDALCLVFLESQFDALSDQLGDDHMVDVLRRTASKMSPRALDVAGGLPLSEQGAALLARAMAGDAT